MSMVEKSEKHRPVVNTFRSNCNARKLYHALTMEISPPVHALIRFRNSGMRYTVMV